MRVAYEIKVRVQMLIMHAYYFFSVLYNSAKQPFKKYLFVCIYATAHVFLSGTGTNRFSSSFSHRKVDSL